MGWLPRGMKMSKSRKWMRIAAGPSVFVAALVGLFAGCAPGNGLGTSGVNETPDNTATYPPINGASRVVVPGPVLATKDDVARKQRLAYYNKVVAAHKFSYSLAETPPSHRELQNITGYKKSGKKPAHDKKPAVVQVPAKWDWRGQGATSIHDQGQCGSCWAFGTTEVVESAIGIFGKQSVLLSEQNVIDCNMDQYDCNGGDFEYAMFEGNYGGILASLYPYTSGDGNDGTCMSSGLPHPYVLTQDWHVDNPGVDAMKSTIYQYGPIGVSMYVCGSFPGYSGGVYDNPECNGQQANHIVSLVGWDDTVPTNEGSGVWILQNSWGTDWGVNGYAYVAYGMAGLEDEMTYVSYNGGGGTPPSGSSSSVSVGSSGSGSSGSGSSGNGGSGYGGSGYGGSGYGGYGYGGSGYGGYGYGGSGGDSGNGGGSSDSCSHDPCATGAALDSSCDPCVTQLCESDNYCCDSDYDRVCQEEASWFCGCQ
jgi:C1A family cysteine protease